MCITFRPLLVLFAHIYFDHIWYILTLKAMQQILPLVAPSQMLGVMKGAIIIYIILII